jgi:tetratricopeptide (TPR) repeat protein
LIKQAQLYYELEDYQKVIESLIEIDEVQKYDKAVRMLAVAFTRRGQSAAAVPLLQSYLQDLPEDGEMIRTLAEAQFLSGNYEEAAETYKYYLGSVDVDNAERQEIMLTLLHCQSAIKYSYLDQYGYAENLGAVVNSSGDDILPLTSQNHPDRYYFSSNRPGAVGGLRNAEGLKDQKLGKYYHDMYRLDINNGGYASVAPIAPLLNSSAHDFVSAFNASGEVLLFVKDQGSRGAQLLSDTFTMDRSIDYYPLPIELPVVPSAGDRDIQLVHDTILLFSSMREGGYGGYDLWVTALSDSTWSEPINLGPSINSAFDEVGGFMTVDGLQLFYASDRPSSSGGLDIFKQRFSLESRTWSPAENLLAPINSSGDDIGFALSPDGSKAMISSNRGGGYGGYDLYFIYLKESIERFDRDLLVLDQRLASEPSAVDSISADPVVIADAQDTPLPTKEIVMPLQTYDGTVGLSDPKVKKTIATIADAILVYPGTQVLIRSKVPKLGDYSREIFFALKQGEEIVKGLLAKGVPATSIFIEGLPSSDAQYSFSPSLWSQSEVLEPLHLDPAQAEVEGLTFKVLYRSVTQMLQSNILAEFECTISKDPSQEAYRIHAGPTRSYQDARRVKNRLLRAEPVAEATILPFMQGMPLSYDRIVELAPQMPELQYYLDDK